MPDISYSVGEATFCGNATHPNEVNVSQDVEMSSNRNGLIVMI